VFQRTPSRPRGDAFAYRYALATSCDRYAGGQHDNALMGRGVCAAGGDDRRAFLVGVLRREAAFWVGEWEPL
jgi:hypothetical protein